MKQRSWLKLVWLVVALLLAWGGYRVMRLRAKLVTLHVRDADVREVARKIGRQTWEEILVHKEVQGRISLDIHSVPLPEALELVARQARCRWLVLHPLYSSKHTLATFRDGVRGDLEPAPGWSNLAFVVHSPIPPTPQQEVLPAEAPITLHLTNCELRLTAMAYSRFANLAVVPEDRTPGSVTLDLTMTPSPLAVKKLAGVVRRQTRRYYGLLPMMGPGPGGPPLPPPGITQLGPPGPLPPFGEPPQGPRPSGPPMPRPPPKELKDQMEKDYVDLMAILPPDQRTRMDVERNAQRAMQQMTPEQRLQAMAQSSSMLEARREGLKQSTIADRVQQDRRDRASNQ